MSNLFVWKEQLQTIYARYSKYIDRALQFILGLFVFGVINANIGFMKGVAQPIVTVAWALICTFLPIAFTAVAAAVLILLHMYSLSMPLAIVAGGMFLLMFIFYFRFTPQRALILLLTPLAFVMKIPFLIPIACGLVGAPILALPIACGTIVYYLLAYVKTSATTISGSNADGLVGKITVFAKQIFQNKEMLVFIIAFTLCLFLVYVIRRMDIDHGWKIAIITGVIVNIVVLVVGDFALDIHVSYVNLIIGSAISAALAMLLEFMVFTVDYSRTERMEFEDDEYYYYVKAVPKLSVTAPEKTVKRINGRQDTANIDSKQVKESVERKRTSQSIQSHRSSNRRINPNHNANRRRTEAQKRNLDHQEMDEAILRKQMNEEFKS
ncbi:MAG: hypothetical protein RR275_08275 [Lachnospiraceae bacterium]